MEGHDALVLYQQRYAVTLLDRYDVINSSSVQTPMPTKTTGTKLYAGYKLEDKLQLLSKLDPLQYLSSRTRVDLSYLVNLLRSRIAKLATQNEAMTKRLLRYLKGRENWGTEFGKYHTQNAEDGIEL